MKPSSGLMEKYVKFYLLMRFNSLILDKLFA